MAFTEYLLFLAYRYTGAQVNFNHFLTTSYFLALPLFYDHNIVLICDFNRWVSYFIFLLNLKVNLLNDYDVWMIAPFRNINKRGDVSIVT